MSRTGFVILTHQSGEQLERLTERLAKSFAGAQCACHHDFGQTPLDVTRFGSHVHFVRPHVATRWGDFSLVTATIAALRLLYERADPDYAILLSGADYPLKNQEDVLRDLDRADADAFCELHLVSPFTPPQPPATNGWPHRQRETFRRYYRALFPIPFSKFTGHQYVTTSNRWITALLAPYSKSFRCWAGPQWMTLGRRAVHTVIDWYDRNPWLEEYLRARPTSIADESYFHSILGNAPHLRVDSRTFRFYQWVHGSQHPEDLTLDLFPELIASGAHFARKLPPGSPLLDRLDEWLDSGKAAVRSNGAERDGT